MRSCRYRAALQPRLSADCDLSYLLTGVFSAPASGVFGRRPTSGTGRRIYNYEYDYYIPHISLYFIELVYSNIDIPVSEFYVKRKIISRIFRKHIKILSTIFIQIFFTLV